MSRHVTAPTCSTTSSRIPTFPTTAPIPASSSKPSRAGPTAGAPVSPGYFIPLAEECGIIRGVGRTLLEKALLETRPWFDDGRLKRVSFNDSPLEFLDEGFSDAVLATIARTGFEPNHLMLEITEGMVIQNLALVEQVMQRLRQRGIKLALDDFVCGYSDLSTLRKLPICVLKIDRSLLVDAEAEQSARIILRSVVSLCRELGILSICEGAETAAQVAFLRTIGCNMVQGFATGRPGPLDAVQKMLRGPRPAAPAARPSARPDARAMDLSRLTAG